MSYNTFLERQGYVWIDGKEYPVESFCYEHGEDNVTRITATAVVPKKNPPITENIQVEDKISKKLDNMIREGLKMKPEIYGLKTKAHLKEAWGIVEHINDCGGVKIKKAAFGWKKGYMITTLELVDGRTSRVSAPAVNERTTIESGVFYAYVRASGKKEMTKQKDASVLRMYDGTYSYIS